MATYLTSSGKVGRYALDLVTLRVCDHRIWSSELGCYVPLRRVAVTHVLPDTR